MAEKGVLYPGSKIIQLVKRQWNFIRIAAENILWVH